MNAGVTDIAQARAKRADSVVSLKREPLTIICQAANIRADGEVHRQIGFSDALTFTELHRVLRICFGLPEEESPWHFYEHTRPVARASIRSARPPNSSGARAIKSTSLGDCGTSSW